MKKRWLYISVIIILIAVSISVWYFYFTPEQEVVYRGTFVRAFETLKG